MEPLISVIIPVYNMEAWIGRCLDSVIGNSYGRLEILCIDDGSTDGSLAVLQAYAQSDPRIVVVAKENGGVSSARNAGLDRMSGEMVTFIDADDFVHPCYFDLMIRAQEQTGADYVIFNSVPVTDDELPYVFPQMSLAEEEIRTLDLDRLFRNRIYRRYCTAVLIRAARIGDLRFREEFSYGEDSIFVGELWENNRDMRACAVPLAIYGYYQRHGSASNGDADQKKVEMVRYFDSRIALSKNNEAIYLDHIIRFLLPVRFQNARIKDRPEIAREADEILKAQRKRLVGSKLFSPWKKLAMLLFISMPSLYRAYIVRRSADVRNWERVARKYRK